MLYDIIVQPYSRIQLRRRFCLWQLRKLARHLHQCRKEAGKLPTWERPVPQSGLFFFCRRFFPGWESQICQLAQQFRPIQYMHPMLRNATNHQPYASVKFSRNKSSTFSYIFKISVAKRQILWGALVWHPQPASRHVASAPVAWGARSRSKCLAVGWYRLGRPMSTQCFGKCKKKRRNGEHIHKNKIK